MNRLLALTVVSLSSAALAQTFFTVEPLGLDLGSQREAAIAQADVVVGLKTIEARHGVRCGAGEFEQRVVTTLDRDCEVRLGSGETRSLVVTFEGYTLAITLKPPADAVRRPVEEYVQRFARINGLETATNFGALKMMADGRYSIGKAQGRWSKRGTTMVFDGPIAHWTMTALPGGDLQFTFLRGPLEFSIVYTPARADDLRAER